VRAKRIIKITAVACLLALITALIITGKSPATGYEASIYTATPRIFWGALLFCAVCGISIAVHQVYAREHEKGSLWVIGFLLVALAYASLLSLWIIRGYPLWGAGDPLTHLGETQDLIASGHASADNYYPITHLYLAEISSLCGIPPIELDKYIPLIFGLLYLAFMYVLAKSIISSKGAVILVAVASTMVLYDSSISFTPNILLNLFLPFALLLLVKKSPPGTILWKALFVIVAFMFPTFHPVPSFVLLLVMITAWFPPKIPAITGGKDSTYTQGVFRFSFPILLFLVVWAITWFSSFSIWDTTMSELRILVDEKAASHLMVLGQQVQYAQEYQYSVGAQFFKLYGGILVYVILALAAFPLLYKKAFSGAEGRNLLSLYGPLAAIALAIMVFFLLNIIFSPLRLMAYVELICTIFAGFTLYKILEKAGVSWSRNYILNKLAPVLVIFILIATFASGALQLYPSRYVLMTSYQVTRTEIAGMDWFFHRKDPTKPITGLFEQTQRFAQFLLTPEERKEQKFVRLELLREGENVMPFHFAYDKYPELGEWYNRIAYLVIIQQDRVVYQEVYPEMKDIRFTPEDFGRLEQDPSVDKLYNNGGLDIYYVTPTPQL
jgi:hypothetical protein